MRLIAYKTAIWICTQTVKDDGVSIDLESNLGISPGSAF